MFGSSADAATDELAAALERVGTDAAVDAGVAQTTIDRIRAGDPDVELNAAATVLALDRDADPDALLAAAREELLVGMSTAILDVETLAGELEIDRDPKELQAMLEGRLSMTIDEYARLRAAILE